MSEIAPGAALTFDEGRRSSRRASAMKLAPAVLAVAIASTATARAALAFDLSSGGDGVWLMVDLAAALFLAGWGAVRVITYRDGAGYLLYASGFAWAVAALCETGGLRADPWLPFGGATDEVQVVAHLLARSLLVGAIIVVLPDRDADGFLRRGPMAASAAGVTVVVVVALTANPAQAILSETPFGFGNRVWIEAGRSLPPIAVAAMVVVEALALLALHHTRRGLPPSSFQVIGWALVACGLPLAIPGVEQRLPAPIPDLVAVVVFPALPIVSAVAALRSTATIAANVARLRAAQRTMIEAVDAERRRLRHDLHDCLGPALAGIELGVRAAGSAVARSDPPTARLLDRLGDEISTCLDDVRRIVYGLRPPPLDQLGLAGAVESHAARCCAAPGNPRLTSSIDDLDGLSASVELAAYAIAIEAITNSIRHARAANLDIALRADGEDVVLAVSDDGCGLPADLAAGVGLLSMRERAYGVGGRLTVGTGPAGGTSVIARLPRMPR